MVEVQRNCAVSVKREKLIYSSGYTGSFLKLSYGEIMTKESQMDKRSEIQGALARGYCTKRNGSKVLDPDLIFDMATEILALGIKINEIIKVLNGEGK